MNIPILSFNSGELSPKIDARSDTEKYLSGCRHLEGFIPEIYGCASRRPGTRYVASQYDTTEDVVRMIPFIFSSDVAYAIEFGDQYLRPFSTVTLDGEIVYNQGSEVILSSNVITTPYLAADLFELHTRQLGDTMWITHKNYAQRKLTRTSSSDFSLDEIPFTKGPFLVRNDLVDANVSDTALMAFEGTIDYGSTDTSYGAGTLTYGAKWTAQTILLTASISFNTVVVKLTRETLSPSGNLVISVKETTSSNPDTAKPTGDDLATASMAASDISIDAPPVFYTFTLSSTVTFEIGKVYAFIVKATSCPGNGIKWHRYNDVTGNSHYAGHPHISSDSGSTWTQINNDDMTLYISNATVIEAGAGYTGNMTCQDDEATPNPVSFFESGHVGSLFKLTYPRVNKVSKCTLRKSKYVSPTITEDDEPYIICAAIDVKGSFRFTTHGLWDGTIELQRNENGAGWETVEIWVVEKDSNQTISQVEDADNVQYRALLTEFTAGEYHDTQLYIRADITITNDTQDTIVRVTAINSTSETAVIVVAGKVVTDPTRRWAEGAWSPLRRYPVSITFFEDRCCYAGMCDLQTQVLFDNAPGHVEPKLPKAWLGASSDYENFEAGVKDADSFELTIPSAEDVAWIDSLEYLMLGTYGGDWRIGSNKMEQPITPTNYSVRQQSSYTCNGIQPVSAEEALLYISDRRIMEELYDANNSKNAATDLTVLAEHITKSGIVDVSMQYDPDQILWCVLGDGSLVAMVYERKENVVAWFKCPIGGTVLSVCVIPGVGEDEVWISIKRTIGGSDVIYIEKMALRDYGYYIDDAYFVDAGLTYTTAEKMTYEGEDLLWEGRIVMFGDAFSTVSGLSHLNGETVSVLADGVVFDDATVASGQITLKLNGVTTTAQKVQVGKKYKSKLMPMRIVTNTPQGSSQGLIARVPRMSISFLNSMGAQYGASDSALYDINWDDPQWENSADSITGLYTGEVTVSVDGGFSVQNPIIISTDAPLPCIVRSIMPRLEITGG